MTLDFNLVKISDGEIVAVEGGHRLTVSASVARVDGDRLSHFVKLVEVDGTYFGWAPEDYQRAHLKAHRAVRDRLRDLRVEHERSVD